MTRRYFELVDDVDREGRWFLNGVRDGTGQRLDCREFRYGKYLDLGPPFRTFLWNEDKLVDVVWPLRIGRRRDGCLLDFTFADHDMPVVVVKIAELLSRAASRDVQRIPVKVDRADEEFEILNIVALTECIDTKRSEIEWFEPGNDIRPDLAGTPQAITKLVIDSDRVGEHHIFRPKGWSSVVIVSDVIKTAFQDSRVSGVRFNHV